MEQSFVDIPFDAVSKSHRDHHYLAPLDLAVTPTGLRRMLIVGSCLADAWGLHRSNPSNCQADYLLINNLSVLPDDPPHPVSEYDFQIVQIPLRSVARSREHSICSYDDISKYAALFADSCSYLDRMLRTFMAWNTKHGILTFVCNFLVPQQNQNGLLLPRYDLRNPMHYVEKLNVKLAELVSTYSNAYLLDFDKICATHGRRYTQDDGVTLWSHGALLGKGQRIEPPERLETLPDMGEHYEVRYDVHKALWIEIEAMYRASLRIDSVKLVVLDLDDTLWKGVSGEMAAVAPSMIEGWPIGVIEALQYLRKRGVLLAITSKNDEERIRSIWDKIFNGYLRIEDFAVVKINWRPKVESMQEILQAVNLLPRSVVFVDDNPTERAAMKHAFPDIRVIGRYPYYVRRILLWSPETQVAVITEESANRTEMVQAQIERETGRAEMSREEFLATLGLKVTMIEIGGTGHSSYPRAFELLNKTNQFNTTGHLEVGRVRGLVRVRRPFPCIRGRGSIH